MSKVKISIVVPIYNNEHLLNKCIDSLLNQTLKDIEVLLINDGSTDNTENLCKNYTKDSRVNYYYKKNGGKSSAVNYGYKYCVGKYILILDSDDYVEPELCKTTYELAEKLDLDIVNYGYTYDQNDTSDIRQSVFPKNKVLSNEDIKSVIKKNTYNTRILWFTWANLIRKELLDKHNILHNEDLKIGVDSTFNLECYVLANKLYSITDVFYHYVYNSESLTQTKYKTDLMLKLQNQFDVKLGLYEKYNLTDNDYKTDFARYYVQHSLLFILSNELNYKDGFQTKRIKEIRCSKVFKYCFKHYKFSSDCPPRKKLIIWCFKNKIYSPLELLLKA